MSRFAMRAVCVFGVMAWATVVRAQPPIAEIRHGCQVLAVAWSADGARLASAGEDGLIRVTDIASGKEVCLLSGGGPITGVVFSPDGKLLGTKSGVKDGPLAVWDIATQKQLRKLSFPDYKCNQLAFTPDGNTLMASGPGEHMVWNHSKGGGYGSRMGKVPEGSSAAASPNGQIAAWCNPQGFVQFFYTDQRKWQNMRIGPAKALAFSPDSKLLAAAADDKTIRLWEVNGPELRKFEGLREPATLVHFAANGKLLAAASPGDPVIRLWEVSTA